LSKHQQPTARGGVVSRKGNFMEWDQITDNWVAMTKRLRNDCTNRPRTIDRKKSTGHATRDSERTVPDTIPSEIADGGHNLSSTE
jgi:hypothetical protein